MTLNKSWDDRGVQAGLRSVAIRAPLVHCLTNVVVAGFTANVLLAVGASPAMVENPAESADFAAIADCVLVNLGTLSSEREHAMRAASAEARRVGAPWVLDPVGAGALAHRTLFAKQLLGARPAVIRGNASEIMSLAGLAGAEGKGVDSVHGSTEAIDAARCLAHAVPCIVAVSGATDFITDGDDVIAVPGGDPLMTRVTGVGCALGALIAACCAVDDQALRAAVTASAVFATAGERAARGRPWPGTFAVRLLDSLGRLAFEATSAGSLSVPSLAGTGPCSEPAEVHRPVWRPGSSHPGSTSS